MSWTHFRACRHKYPSRPPYACGFAAHVDDHLMHSALQVGAVALLLGCYASFIEAAHVDVSDAWGDWEASGRKQPPPRVWYAPWPPSLKSPQLGFCGLLIQYLGSIIFLVGCGTAVLANFHPTTCPGVLWLRGFLRLLGAPLLAVGAFLLAAEGSHSWWRGLLPPLRLEEARSVNYWAEHLKWVGSLLFVLGAAAQWLLEGRLTVIEEAMQAACAWLLGSAVLAARDSSHAVGGAATQALRHRRCDTGAATQALRHRRCDTGWTGGQQRGARHACDAGTFAGLAGRCVWLHALTRWMILFEMGGLRVCGVGAGVRVDMAQSMGQGSAVTCSGTHSDTHVWANACSEPHPHVCHDLSALSGTSHSLERRLTQHHHACGRPVVLQSAMTEYEEVPAAALVGVVAQRVLNRHCCSARSVRVAAYVACGSEGIIRVVAADELGAVKLEMVQIVSAAEVVCPH
eukprot:jgi/Ulvmu1/470/UM001_0478.1